MTGIPKLHYFFGRGRAETTRWMLAIDQIEFKNVAIKDANMLAELRNSGKLPFDQMPLLEIDGNNLSQSSAMVRYLARRGNFYGDNNNDALWCDMIAGVVADFAEAAMQAAFQSTRQVVESNLTERFNKFGPCFEQRLIDNGSGYCAGKHLTFADVLLVEALNSYLEWIPNLLRNFPQLTELYNRIMDQPGIVNYLKSAERYPNAGSDYVIDVARVLERKLPAHIPNPDRFIKI